MAFSNSNGHPEFLDEESTDLLLKTTEENLTRRIRNVLSDYFSVAEREDRYSPDRFAGVVVDQHFYRNNREFLRKISNGDDSFFNPLVMIARGNPAEVVPDYPVDTVHEIHDLSDEDSNLEEDLKPLLAVRKLTRQLTNVQDENESDNSSVKDPIRKRYKRIIYEFQTRMHQQNHRLFTHSRRTATYAGILARKLGWSKKRRENLYIASLIHDIGKMAIPDPILYKPGSLTDDEFEIVKDHSSRGHACFPDRENPLLKTVSDVSRYHHEQWNGKGYPEGLEGNEIPLSARIVAVADVFDALTHNRVYRDRMNEDEALDIIRDNRGQQFDPDVVDHFFEVVPRLRQIDQ